MSKRSHGARDGRSAINPDRLNQAKREIAEVEKWLKAGHPPIGVTGSHKIVSAVRHASDALGEQRTAFGERLGNPSRIGAWKRQFNLAPDWSLYKGPDLAELKIAGTTTPAGPPSDPIDLLRLRDEVQFLRAALKESQRRTAEAEDIRAGVLGLTQEALQPQLVVPTAKDKVRGGRTVILHLSDVHYGEVIVAEEMDNLNRYDSTLAQIRLGRFFSTATDLMTKYWKGDPPEEIILCLGGDLISGNIHPELEQTNMPAVPATVREVGEHIAGGVIMLRNNVKCPMRVYSVPGNHGRMSIKPQSKGRSAGSLDLLATDFAEAIIRGARLRDVAVYKAQSPDAYFSTYGWHWLLNHGDSMGGRGGGTGFIGPMATIIKGHRKLVDTSWRSGKPVHYVMTGHYHTTGKTSFGWANGSVCGYGEYARDLRADPEPSRQNYLVVHPRHGVIEERPLYLGAPGEGALYAGPASVIRPQWGAE
jgi:hypothetical protein